MHFTITRKDIIPVLTRCAAIADRKSTMPILANVLLAAADDLLTVSATDLSRSVTGTVCTADAEAGSVAVDARGLLDRVKAMPEGAIVFATKGPTLEIKAKGASRRYTLGTIPGDEFPALPDPGKAKVVATGLDGSLAKAIRSVRFAVSADETRLHLNSMLLNGNGEGLLFAATDGHRLSLATLTSTAKVRDILIPLPALDEIIAASESAGCSLALDAHHLFVTASTLTVAIKLADATFPPYQQVVPPRADTFSVDRSALLEAFRSVVLAASDKTGGVLCKLDGSTLTLKAESPDGGEGVDEVAVDWAGKSHAVGLNARYVLDVLGALDCERVDIAVTGELDPVTIRPAGADTYTAVVMPMRI